MIRLSVLLCVAAVAITTGARFDASVTRPDLVVQAVSNPPSAVPRRAVFRAADTVRNIGGVKASRSTTRFYLSRDRGPNRRDVRLVGKRTLGSLQGNTSSQGVVNVRVPARTARGAYFVLACADGGGEVRERNERNNCRSSRRRTNVTALRPPVSRARAALYAATSPFNTPIPANAQVDPNSARYVAGLREAAARSTFTIALRKWTVPVYEAGPATPRFNVKLTASWRSRDWMEAVPIPPSAAPDSEDDAHMTVLDRKTGCEFDFYDARKVDGRWFADWANALLIRGRGIYPRGLSTRGSGFANLAGLIWPHELKAREIPHALMFSYPHTSARGAVAPATETDGRSTRADALPEGARLQLDPTLDLDRLRLRPYERTIARALQRYGMYLGDTGGGAPSLYAVHAQSYRSDRYAGLLPSVDYPPLANIPIDRFRVLELGPITSPARLSSRARVVPTPCARMRR
jgi:hypothetical protein